MTAFDKGKRPFFWQADPTPVVTENRTFGATFDFSGVASGTEFEVELRDQDKMIRGIIAPTPKPEITPIKTTTTTATTAPTTTTTTTTTATTATTAPPPTSIPTEAPITAQTVSKGGLPEFDLTVALAALVATALLALRRSE